MHWKTQTLLKDIPDVEMQADGVIEKRSEDQIYKNPKFSSNTLTNKHYDIQNLHQTGIQDTFKFSSPVQSYFEKGDVYSIAKPSGDNISCYKFDEESKGIGYTDIDGTYQSTHGTTHAYISKILIILFDVF